MDRRNVLLVALGVVAVVAIVVVVAVVTGGGDDDDVDVVDDTTSSSVDDTATTETTEPTTSETTAPAAPGETIVAVDGDGRVVVLGDDGAVDRVLLEGIRVDDPAKNGIAVAAERGEVYVTRPGAPGDVTELVRVNLAGDDDISSLGEGIAPSVSSDGDRLAFVRFDTPPSPADMPAPVLVIRDLDTGVEVEMRRDAEPPFVFVPDTAWTASGEQVAFVAGETVTGLYVVDADAASLDEARRLGPTARGERASWSAVTGFGEDRLAVVERCCDVGDQERWLVLAVNITQAEAEGGLLPGERTEASRLDSPGGEERLLYVTDLQPGGGTLHRWDGAGDPEVVAEDIVVAAW